jgi:hypothetical protein
MTEADGKAWLDVLNDYEYKVDFAKFRCGFRSECGFSEYLLQTSLDPGNREQTTNFETLFRNKAQSSLEAWYAIIFWKMYSQRGRANIRTCAAIQRINRQNHNATQLWTACSRFVNTGTVEIFQVLQRMVISGKNLPMVATFPAFMAPERFPMVDSRIAVWVNNYLNRYTQDAGIYGSRLLRICNPKSITIYNWKFYDSWIRWCREAAKVLTRRTVQNWRARDVEMAAFQNSEDGDMLPHVF